MTHVHGVTYAHGVVVQVITLKVTRIRKEYNKYRKEVEIQVSKYLPWASGPGAASYTALTKTYTYYP